MRRAQTTSSASGCRPRTLRTGAARLRKRVSARPPAAELRRNPTDQDSRPPYEGLDPIIRGYVEEDQSLAALIAAGFDRHTVEQGVALVDRSEYKRRQSPPGVRITHR